MLSFLQLIVTLLAFILSHKYEAIAVYVPPYSSLIVPITKHTDAATPLYSVQFETSWDTTRSQPKNFVIDTDASFIWNDCGQWNLNDQPGICPDSVCVSPISCENDICTQVRTSVSFKDPSCPLETNSSTLPDWGDCTCPVNVVNPFTGSCIQGVLNYEDLILRTSNGTNPIDSIYAVTPNGACAPSSSFESFPADVTGVLALSTSPYAFQSFINKNHVTSIISLCLPNTTSNPGVLFFGNGPYYFNNVDVRSYLSYTPLLNHPDSFGYFIGVSSIVIKKRSIEVPTNTTTKLSTIEPYTTLRTDIYNQVIRRFSMVTKRIETVKPIAPFGLCYKSYTNGTEFGLKVPNIDFGLENGKNWTVSTANSMKQVTEDVACLAFVDGGAISEHGIVIGTFQFEDNFVSFDLKNSTFGFSSSLLNKQISCANFNFTTMGSN